MARTNFDTREVAFRGKRGVRKGSGGVPGPFFLHIKLLCRPMRKSVPIAVWLLVAPTNVGF